MRYRRGAVSLVAGLLATGIGAPPARAVPVDLLFDGIGPLDCIAPADFTIPVDVPLAPLCRESWATLLAPPFGVTGTPFVPASFGFIPGFAQPAGVVNPLFAPELLSLGREFLGAPVADELFGRPRAILHLDEAFAGSEPGSGTCTGNPDLDPRGCETVFLPPNRSRSFGQGFGAARLLRSAGRPGATASDPNAGSGRAPYADGSENQKNDTGSIGGIQYGGRHAPWYPLQFDSHGQQFGQKLARDLTVDDLLDPVLGSPTLESEFGPTGLMLAARRRGTLLDTVLSPGFLTSPTRDWLPSTGGSLAHRLWNPVGDRSPASQGLAILPNAPVFYAGSIGKENRLVAGMVGPDRVEFTADDLPFFNFVPGTGVFGSNCMTTTGAETGCSNCDSAGNCYFSATNDPNDANYSQVRAAWDAGAQVVNGAALVPGEAVDLAGTDPRCIADPNSTVPSVFGPIPTCDFGACNAENPIGAGQTGGGLCYFNPDRFVQALDVVSCGDSNDDTTCNAAQKQTISANAIAISVWLDRPLEDRQRRCQKLARDARFHDNFGAPIGLNQEGLCVELRIGSDEAIAVLSREQAAGLVDFFQNASTRPAGAFEEPTDLTQFDVLRQQANIPPARPPGNGVIFAPTPDPSARRVDPATGAPVNLEGPLDCSIRTKICDPGTMNCDTAGLPVPVGPDGIATPCSNPQFPNCPTSGRYGGDPNTYSGQSSIEDSVPSVGNCLFFDNPDNPEDVQTMRSASDIALSHHASQTLFHLLCTLSFDLQKGYCFLEEFSNLQNYNFPAGDIGGGGYFANHGTSPEFSSMTIDQQALIGCGPRFVSPCDSGITPGAQTGEEQMKDDFPFICASRVTLLNPEACDPNTFVDGLPSAEPLVAGLYAGGLDPLNASGDPVTQEWSIRKARDPNAPASVGTTATAPLDCPPGRLQSGECFLPGITLLADNAVTNDFELEGMPFPVDQFWAERGVLLFDTDPTDPKVAALLNDPNRENCTPFGNLNVPVQATDPGCTLLEEISANLERFYIEQDQAGQDGVSDPPESFAEILAMLDADPNNDITGDPYSGPDGINSLNFDAKIRDPNSSDPADPDLWLFIADESSLTDPNSDWNQRRDRIKDEMLTELGISRRLRAPDGVPLPPIVAGGKVIGPCQSLNYCFQYVGDRNIPNFSDKDGNPNTEVYDPYIVAALPIQVNVCPVASGCTTGATDNIAIDPRLLTAEQILALQLGQTAELSAAQTQDPNGNTLVIKDGIDANGLQNQSNNLLGLLYLDTDQDFILDLDQDGDGTLDFFDDGTPGPVSDDHIRCGSGLPGDPLQTPKQHDLVDETEQALIDAISGSGLPPRSPVFCPNVARMLGLVSESTPGRADFVWHGGEAAAGIDTADPDADAVPNFLDNCPDHANPAQEDDDADAIGNACDVCPSAFDPQQSLSSTQGAGGPVGAACLCGDTNGDGAVDMADVQNVGNVSVGVLPPDALPLATADIDRSGGVNIVDAQGIGRVSVAVLPICDLHCAAAPNPGDGDFIQARAACQ